MRLGGAEFGWRHAVHTVTLRVDDPATLARVTDEECEPVLYFPSDPTVVLLLDSLPAAVKVHGPTGTFYSSGWVINLLPGALLLVGIFCSWLLLL